MMLRIKTQLAQLTLLVMCACQANSDQEAITQERPDARTRAHLIYHPQLKALLLIDGYCVPTDSTRNDAWSWDGNIWRKIKAFGPGPRIVNAAAIDKKTGDVWTSGGWGAKGIDEKKGDFWKFSGTTWSAVSTPQRGTRDHHKMVYADHLDAMVMYGGFTENFSPDTVTWIIKGEKFSPMLIPGPGPRGNFGFTYDPTRKKVVLIGGKMAPDPADLWEFDGKSWQSFRIADIGLTTVHSIIYCDDRKKVLVHTTLGETWSWDGGTLDRVAKSGPRSWGIALGYDPVRQVVAGYGGFGQDMTSSSALWELKDTVWSKISDGGTWVQISRDVSRRMEDQEATIYNKAIQLLDQQLKAEAINTLQVAIDDGSSSPVLLAKLGDLHRANGDYLAALPAYRKLTSVKNVYPLENYLTLAIICVKLERIDEALGALETLIAKGYTERGQLENNADLARLKTERRFQILMDRLKR